jgi:hypothetical protein
MRGRLCQEPPAAEARSWWEGHDDSHSSPSSQPGEQTRDDLVFAAYGNARTGLECQSLRMIELAGRCALRAMGVAR